MEDAEAKLMELKRLGEASASARDSVVRAVWKARNLIRDLGYLYGNDLQHAEKLRDVLVVLEDADALVVLGYPLSEVRSDNR